MPTLAELQSQMAVAILTQGAAVPATIRCDGIPAAQRLDVYRSNTLGALSDALADAFPVVCQLVGERFFAAVAQAFVYAEPPATSCLAEYGAGFPAFLAGFEPARALPYLPDAARLDWAVHRAFHAPDAAALDPACVAAIAPSHYDGLRFTPHPACRIVTSRFPVDRIWRAHHGDGDFADIDLAQNSLCRVLVDRNQTAIRLLELGDGECALLEALFAAQPLGEALAAALAREPGLELPPLLARHLQRATFSDVILPSTTDAQPRTASN
ncbi:HvfC/BufC family peptide modification chaperone [Pelagibius marinus]|uniref:HvfC/BufC family peptide modification chaperone n=1 Tax=Pelagibius marinus TaxID=2762760 RepID=UPI0018722B69|nr:DNA-binding domain-containing protein [Pelagibius marinus]